MNYLTADLHLWHTNLCKGSTTWLDSDQHTRDFPNEFEMTEHVIAQINKYVQPDDVLYLLGDFSFSGQDKIWKGRKRLHVRTIHLIYGNHDIHIKRNKILRMPHEDFRQMRHLIRDAERCMGYDLGETVVLIPAQNLFTSCQDRLETVIDGRMMVLDHYPLSVWNGSHKGVVLCHGHCHGSFQGVGKILDVGIDNAFKLFGEYRPFSAEVVIRMLDKKEIQHIDHHSSSTNFAGLT